MSPRPAAVLACLAALACAGPAAAQSIGEKTGVNALLGVAPKTEDFVREAALSDMFEMQSSQIALERAGDEPTKAYAREIIADHEKTSGEMKAMITGGKVRAEVPTALDSSHQGKLDKLKGLQGADFAKQYHADQVSGHKDAVDLFQRYAKGGDDADLKAWAERREPTLAQHLKAAQDLDK